MSFNIDDPLAGILSDESDDSFFDDDILGKKKPSKKKDTPILEKKKALFDLNTTEMGKTENEKSLFDDGEKKKSNFGKTEMKVDINMSPSPTTFRRSFSKDSLKRPNETVQNPVSRTDTSKSPSKSQYSTIADKIDILDELDTEKKRISKPLTKGKSSQSLLDDILGGSTTKVVSKTTSSAKAHEFDLDSILGKSESKQTLNSGNINISKQNIEIKSDVNKHKDVENQKPKSDDWLGIFNDKDDDEGTDSMPAWLGGGDKKKKLTENKAPSKPEQKVIKEKAESNKNESPTKQNLEQSKTMPSPTIIPMQNSKEDITTEGAAYFVQQQEAQLMVALQLKAQEEKVAAIQMRHQENHRIQRAAEIAQQSQMEAMLKRQAEHRMQMQAVINAHQDRITQRIKALLGPNTEDIEVEANESEEFERALKQETPHMKEKKQLLQLVQSLQENHDKEIDLMETSYRRQLAFVEISSNQAEERMKEETEKLVKFYSEKINWLEEHHQSYKKLTENNLSSLAERHKNENEILRQQHFENIKVLQEHHTALMENIKNAVKQEQNLIKDSGGFSNDLQELMKDVKDNNVQCKELVQLIQTITEKSRKEEDKNLQNRDTQITEMIQQLKREREYFETEKNESREVVKLLETRLKQMTTMIEEDAAHLKQKRMEFEFEKATFSKQTEFAKNVLKKQDEEIKMLKEEIQKEYQDKIGRIEEQKVKAIKDSAAVAKDKASINGIKQDLEKMKTELQAQLEEITEERSKLSLERQQLHIEEQKVSAKSRDLDLLAKTAMEKQSQADKKYSEAEFLQKKYEERIRRMQEHVVSLNTREQQIAREKVTLSRERLNLHNERKQIESKQQCSLCKTTQYIPQYNYDAYIPEAFLNAPVSRDYGSAKTESMFNVIENEMAHLAGKRFTRHNDVGNVDWNQGHLDDVGRKDHLHEAPLDSVGVDGVFKEYMDPKFLMMRLDVQQVIHNLEASKKDVTNNQVANGEE